MFKSCPVLAIVVLPFFACSSSSSSSGVSSDAGAAADASPDAGPPSSFTVVENESPSTPIPGAIVNLDYGDGSSELQTAGADGSVTFSSASRASGILDLSAGFAGRIVTTALAPDLTKLASKPLKLTLRAPTGSPLALTGAITNKNAATDRLSLTTTLPVPIFDTATASYSLSLPGNTAFTLVGLDYLPGGSGRNAGYTIGKWFHIDHAPLTAATTLDIDVSAQTADTATTVSGTITIPPAAPATFKSTCKATVYVYGFDVTTLAYTAQVGAFVTTTLSADQSSFGYTVQYITLPNVVPFTIAELDAEGAGSQRILQGAPSDALTTSDFAVPLPIAGTLSAGSTLDATAATDPTFLIVSAAGQGVWTVILAPGTTAKLPALPAAFKAIIGTAKLSGYLDTCRYFDADSGVAGVCTHQTFSKTAAVEL